MSDVDLLTMIAKIDEHNKSSFAMSVASVSARLAWIRREGARIACDGRPHSCASLLVCAVSGHGGMQTEVELSHEAGSNVFYGDKIDLPNKGFRLRFSDTTAAAIGWIAGRCSVVEH